MRPSVSGVIGVQNFAFLTLVVTWYFRGCAVLSGNGGGRQDSPPSRGSPPINTSFESAMAGVGHDAALPGSQRAFSRRLRFLTRILIARYSGRARDRMDCAVNRCLRSLLSG